MNTKCFLLHRCVYLYQALKSPSIKTENRISLYFRFYETNYSTIKYIIQNVVLKVLYWGHPLTVAEHLSSIRLNS